LATVAIQSASAQVATGAATSAPQPLARAAFLATMDEEFRKSDGNKDGTVTGAELASYQQQAATAALVQRAQAAFAAMDKDRNGQVSADEFVRANAGSAKKVDVAPMMTRLDTNRDQKVSLVEYRTLTLATFDRLDADKDGVVSPAEQRAGGFAK
jgi:Ca2+-binding EF-hand superfamily protein